MTTRAPIPTLLAVLLFATALIAAGGHAQDAKEEPKVPAGQQAFLKYKCNSCHTLEAAKVVKVEDEEEAKDSSSKRKPPDLSGVGKKHTAAWMEKYLTKKEMIAPQTLHAQMQTQQEVPRHRGRAEGSHRLARDVQGRSQEGEEELT